MKQLLQLLNITMCITSLTILGMENLQLQGHMRDTRAIRNMRTSHTKQHPRAHQGRSLRGSGKKYERRDLREEYIDHAKRQQHLKP
jgi:hypothetical protein